MASDKNARYEQEWWSVLRPICHADAAWMIRVSPATNMYSFHCAHCERKCFQFTIQPSPS